MDKATLDEIRQLRFKVELLEGQRDRHQALMELTASKLREAGANGIPAADDLRSKQFEQLEAIKRDIAAAMLVCEAAIANITPWLCCLPEYQSDYIRARYCEGKTAEAAIQTAHIGKTTAWRIENKILKDGTLMER